MKKKNCRGCNSEDIIEFLDLGLMPLAGGFLPSKASVVDEKKYPLSVYVCDNCGLVQILDPVDPDVLFQDYSFSSSTIAPLVAHFESYSLWLIENLAPQKVVEFGCNDGVLLAPLKMHGVEAIGVDVSENITEMGREKGLDIITGFFDESVSNSIIERIDKVDVVTGSNVFAHNDNPQEIIKAASNILKDDGYFCIEVMYAGDLLDSLQWDTLYHEHLTFYSLTSLKHLLKRFGFEVVKAERVPMHGGSLRIAATRDKSAAVSSSIDEILEYEREHNLAKTETWLDFAALSHRKISVVTEVFDQLSSSSRIWGYGAAGKATFWVNACNMHYIERMVDSSPLRVGKFMPGIHTPIVSPEEMQADPPDIVLITAWNYANHIRDKEIWFQGMWAVPLPDLRFF